MSGARQNAYLFVDKSSPDQQLLSLNFDVFERKKAYVKRKSEPAEYPFMAKLLPITSV